MSLISSKGTLLTMAPEVLKKKMISLVIKVICEV